MKDRLKLLRNTLHLTQEDLAARIGVKRNSYANYETGRYRTNDAVVHCICREFRVSETWLRTGEGEMFLPEDEEQQLINWAKGIFADESAAFQRRFVLMLSELTPSQWNTLRDVACMIAGLPEKDSDGMEDS